MSGEGLQHPGKAAPCAFTFEVIMNDILSYFEIDETIEFVGVVAW